MMRTETLSARPNTKTGRKTFTRWTKTPVLNLLTTSGMPVFRISCLFVIALVCSETLYGQTDIRDYNTRYVGEFGLEGGVAEYFGDLNTRSSFQSVKPTVGLFYRYFFSDYLGASAHLHFAEVGFSDYYNTNTFEHTRNLSFDSNIWDFSVRWDVNFFHFVPGSVSYRFTPYFSLGLGAMHFNPYTYYDNHKYYLQPLGTEGQGSPLYPGRKPYSLWTLEVPVGVGVKYNLNRSWNVAASATYYFTRTDYLDDVSKTYAGQAAFPPDPEGGQTLSSILQDRSGVYGTPIGVAGRQRGNSRNFDQFIGIEISIAYLLDSYHCPEF